MEAGWGLSVQPEYTSYCSYVTGRAARLSLKGTVCKHTVRHMKFIQKKGALYVQ